MESWQSTVWGYWETIKGFGKSGGSKVLINAAKKAVAERLKTYKYVIKYNGYFSIALIFFKVF